MICNLHDEDGGLRLSQSCSRPRMCSEKNAVMQEKNTLAQNRVLRRDNRMLPCAAREHHLNALFRYSVPLLTLIRRKTSIHGEKEVV
jgi:hypothetical protein